MARASGVRPVWNASSSCRQRNEEDLETGDNESSVVFFRKNTSYLRCLTKVHNCRRTQLSKLPRGVPTWQRSYHRCLHSGVNLGLGRLRRGLGQQQYKSLFTGRSNHVPCATSKTLSVAAWKAYLGALRSKRVLSDLQPGALPIAGRPPLANGGFIERVTDGARTRDLRSHNPNYLCCEQRITKLETWYLQQFSRQ